MSIRFADVARWAAIALCAAVGACASAPAASVAPRTQTAAYEDVYVLRTTRASTVEGATPECASAPFPVRQHDVYELHSIEVDAGDALVTDPLGPVVGGFNGCLGEFKDGAFDMFMSGALNGADWSGVAHCVLLADQPVPQALLIHCTSNIDDPPDGYVGGLMISNSLSPRGGALDLPGYTTTSVLVMRLWKTPPA